MTWWHVSITKHSGHVVKTSLTICGRLYVILCLVSNWNQTRQQNCLIWPLRRGGLWTSIMWRNAPLLSSCLKFLFQIREFLNPIHIGLLVGILDQPHSHGSFECFTKSLHPDGKQQHNVYASILSLLSISSLWRRMVLVTDFLLRTDSVCGRLQASVWQAVGWPLHRSKQTCGGHQEDQGSLDAALPQWRVLSAAALDTATWS